MIGPKELIDKLHKNQELSLEEWTELIKNRTPELRTCQRRTSQILWARRLCPWSNRVYKLLSKRLPLLWYSKK